MSRRVSCVRSYLRKAVTPSAVDSKRCSPVLSETGTGAEGGSPTRIPVSTVFAGASLRRTRDERGLGHVVRHRDADAAEQLNPFRDRIDELVLFAEMLVEQQMQLIEGRPRHLPVVFLVEIAQRDRVGEQLIQILHA